MPAVFHVILGRQRQEGRDARDGVDDKK